VEFIDQLGKVFDRIQIMVVAGGDQLHTRAWYGAQQQSGR
jgi:hypothetical protein